MAKITKAPPLHPRPDHQHPRFQHIAASQRHVPAVRDQPPRDDKNQLFLEIIRDCLKEKLFLPIGVFHSRRQTRAHSLAHARSGQHLATGRMRTRRESKVISTTNFFPFSFLFFPFLFFFLVGGRGAGTRRCRIRLESKWNG